MKKYVLSGHGRILLPLGEKSHKRASPKNGWLLKCICGWSQSDLKNKRDAESAYSKHILDSMPICISCNEEKPLRFMSKSFHGLCKSCSSKKSKQWAIENPNEWERHRRKSHLRKKYNISIDEYNQMINDQENKCAICNHELIDSRGFRPHIDHCHKTGKVRGILCGDCNKALGGFKDDIHRIKNAHLYLLKFQS